MTRSGHDCRHRCDLRECGRIDVHDRDKQHIAVVLGLGGLYPAKDTVRALLAPQTGEQKAILDLGESY